MRARLMRVLGVLTAVSVVSGLFPAPPASAAGTSVMVVGDSISQGMEGDFTWRYRLAQHLGAAADFVGPWTGTNVVPAAYPPGWPNSSAPPIRTGSYRPGVSFDSAHLAQWGWQLHQAKDAIGAQVATYQPSVLLVELGFNDLGWGVNGPAGVLNDLRTFVANARAAKPNVRFAVANVLHRTALADLPQLPGTITDYNGQLGTTVAALSTTTSPVALVDIDTPYDENRDAYDGLHPGVRGEYVIAKAFGDVLSSRFGLGPAFGAVPASLPAALVPGTPASITATPVEDKVRVAWTHVFGAAAYEFYQRDATTGQAFSKSAWDIGADSWTADILPAGHRIEFYVRAVRGAVKGAASPTAAATVRSLPAVPDVRVSTDAGRPYSVTVSWGAVAGADDYHVYSASGCDSLPPAKSAFALQQWNLGGKTSWTQEYVTADCVWYKVVASRYGGENPWPATAAHAVPYQNNYLHLTARNRYIDRPADAGDVQARTTTTPGTDRGIVVVRGFIRNTSPLLNSIGDHRQFDMNPYASAKIGMAWDTKTGDIGVYVHKSCVIGGVPLPPEVLGVGCRNAKPVQFVADAGTYGDADGSGYNYVSKAWVNGSLVVKFSAVNSWSRTPFGRINATVTLTPSGNSFRATLTADKFPAWEVFRYPHTAPLSGTFGVSYTIGTRDQTNINDLIGPTLVCKSVPPESYTIDYRMGCP